MTLSVVGTNFILSRDMATYSRMSIVENRIAASVGLPGWQEHPEFLSSDYRCSVARLLILSFFSWNIPAQCAKVSDITPTLQADAIFQSGKNRTPVHFLQRDNIHRPRMTGDYCT